MQPTAVKKRKLPLICKIMLIIGLLSACLYVAFVQFPDFADWFNTNISAHGRAFFAMLGNWLPFSIAELLILLIPLWIVLLILVGYRRYCGSWRNALTYVGILFSCVSLVLSIFVWNFAPGYYARPLEKKLGLIREKSSATELFQTAELLSAEFPALVEEITFLENGASVMPYSYAEMNDKLMEAYRKAAQKYDFINTFDSTVKPVMLSEPMSYTHITGVYTFFTGEANINVNFPDYTIPYTAAHELAHQRGIAREDEANFVAFLVCIESDDPYIRYSGYLNTYEYVASALSSANRELYKKSYNSLPQVILKEESAYRTFFQKYRENVVATVSQAVNDTYLKTHGSSAGTRSYNLVVDLAVAYYREKIDP